MNPVPTPTNEFYKSAESDDYKIAIVACGTSIDSQDCFLCTSSADEAYNCTMSMPANIEFGIGINVLLKDNNEIEYLNVFDSSTNFITSKPKIDLGTFICTYNSCEQPESEFLIEQTDSNKPGRDTSWTLLNTIYGEGASNKGRKDFDNVEKDKFIYIMGGEGDTADFDDVVACDMNNEPPVCNVITSMTMPVTGCTSVVAVDLRYIQL